MASLSICADTRKQFHQKWSDIRHGGFSLLHLSSRAGAGSHQLIRGFQNEVAMECLTWHAQFFPQERNVHILPKLLDGLWKNIRQSQTKCLQIIKALQDKLPLCASQEEQVQLQTLIDSLRASRLSEGDQVLMHDNRPIRALIMLLQIVLERFRVLLILEDLHNCHSATPYVWIDAVLRHLPIEIRFMMILTTQSESLKSSALPQALNVILSQHNFETLTPNPWTIEDLQQIELPISPPTMLWWTEGFPGRVLELNALPESTLYTEPQLNLFTHDNRLLLHAAALYGYRFPLSLIARACELSTKAARDILEQSSGIFPQASDPEGRSEIWAFESVSLQLKIRSEALKEPAAESNLFLYERHEGIRDKTLLLHLLDAYAQNEDAQGCKRVHNILHSAETDLSWLHLSDICIAYQLSWPSPLLSTALLAGLRYLYAFDLERAKRMLVWTLQWAVREKMPRTAIEAIRMHAQYFDRNNDPITAKTALDDAIEIAQETQDTLYLIGLHLDKAEHHLFNNEDREAQVALQIVRSQKLIPGHGVRYLTLLARIDMRAARYRVSAEQLTKARALALEHGLIRSATDTGLMKLQALLNIENASLSAITALHKVLASECAPFAQRQKIWEDLKKEIIART